MSTVQRSILIEAPALIAFAYWKESAPLHGVHCGPPVAGSGDDPPAGIHWHIPGTSLVDAAHSLVRSLRWTLSDFPGATLTMTFAPLHGDACWMVSTLEVEDAGRPAGSEGAIYELAHALDTRLDTARDNIELAYFRTRATYVHTR